MRRKNSTPYRRIIIIGPGGAGKSYFSKQLAIITKLPLYHLDNIFWKEDRTHITREEFDKKLLGVMFVTTFDNNVKKKATNR